MKIEMTIEEYNMLRDCMVKGIAFALTTDNDSDLEATYNKLLYEITQNVRYTDDLEIVNKQMK